MSNIALLSHNAKTDQWEASFNGRVFLKSASKDYVIEKIEKQISNKAKQLGVTRYEEIGTPTATNTMAANVVEHINFDINERFMFLEDFTSMVADRTTPSTIITGEGGLGKTHTVMATLRKCGLTKFEESSTKMKVSEDDEAEIEIANTPRANEFVVVKGYSTAKGLFRTLYQNRNSIIVFDDCDSVLRDEVACNLLKAALDSYDERIVTWNSMGWSDDGLPTSFEFTGGVIFISNMPMYKIPQAIVSRAYVADVSMTRAEIVVRMHTIAHDAEFMGDVDYTIKNEALAFIAEHAMHPSVKTLNLRTLIGVIKARQSKPEHWQRLALYSMVNAR